MNRFTALASVAALCIAAAATPMPAFADQGAYTGHQLDCLSMLFNNSEAHATECGGPFSLGTPKTIETPGSGDGGGCTLDPLSYRSTPFGAQFLPVISCCDIISQQMPAESGFSGGIQNVDCVLPPPPSGDNNT